jgi:hypothetical protein
MANIKYGALVSSISGSVGGATFQRSASGNTLRSKPIPIHQKTSIQLDRRAFMKACQNAWVDLPEASRKKWRQFVEYSRQTINNDSDVLISGYNLYLKYQFCRYLFNLGILVDFDYIKLPVLASVFNVFRASNQFYVNFDVAMDTEEILCVFSLSRAQNTNSRFSAVNCRFMYFEPAGSNDFDIKDSFTSKFGLLPGIGDTLSWSCYFFSTKSPILSGFQSGTLIVQGATQSGWVSRSGLNLTNFSAIGFDGTHYFAMTLNQGSNNFAISTDAISWSLATSGINGIVKAVARLGNNLIAVSSLDANCAAYYSDSSGVWHAITSMAGTEWSCIAAGEGVCLAMTYMGGHAYLGVCRSISDFTAYDLGQYQYISDICYGSSFFIAIQTHPVALCIKIQSSGSNWSFTNFTMPKAFTHLCYGNSNFIFSGTESGNLVFGVTSDMVNWQYSIPINGASVNDLAFNGSRFVALVTSVGNNYVLSSVDGLDWIQEAIPVTCILSTIFANGSLFVAASSDEHYILTSN